MSEFLANFNSRFAIDFILADCPKTAMGHGRLWIREYPSFSLLADLLQAPALNEPFIFVERRLATSSLIRRGFPPVTQCLLCRINLDDSARVMMIDEAQGADDGNKK